MPFNPFECLKKYNLPEFEPGDSLFFSYLPPYSRTGMREAHVCRVTDIADGKLFALVESVDGRLQRPAVYTFDMHNIERCEVIPESRVVGLIG